MAFQSFEKSSAKACTGETSEDLIPILSQNDLCEVEKESISSESTRKNSESRPWKPSEDYLLGRLAMKHNKNWKLIQKRFPERSIQESRRRFAETRGNLPFSREESQIIIDFYSQHGAKWKTLAETLVLHPPDKIKHFFYANLSQKLSSDKIRFLSLNRNCTKKYENLPDETVIPESGINNQSEDIETNHNTEIIQTSTIPNSNTPLNQEDKRRKVQELFRKMTVLQAFIKQTEQEISNLR